MKKLILLLFISISFTICVQGQPTPPTQHGNHTNVFNNKTKQFEPYGSQAPIGSASIMLVTMSAVYVMSKIKRKK